MIYGSHKNERLCFNDGTLWSGYPKDYNSAESFENLEKVRQLIFDGRNSEADALCGDKLFHLILTKLRLIKSVLLSPFR